MVEHQIPPQNQEKKRKSEPISRRKFLKLAAISSFFLGTGIGALLDYETDSIGVLDKLFGAFPREARMNELLGVKNALDRPIYWGAATNDQHWLPLPEGRQPLEKLNMNPAIEPVYLDWNPDEGDSSGFPMGTMTEMKKNGIIPSITWMPEIAGGDESVNAKFALKRIAAGEHDAHITKWAEEAKEFDSPFFLRFCHEMNGGWYPWGVDKHWRTGITPNQNTPEDFVKAWQHVHDIFEKVGATQVTWVWCPDTAGNLSVVDKLYPGSKYVDWTAMDGYNWGNEDGGHKMKFKDIFSPLYNKLLQLAPEKPIMLAEFGVAKHVPNRAKWFVDVFRDQIPNFFAQIQAAVYFDREKPDEGNNWLIEGDAEVEAVMTEIMKTPFYRKNEFGNMPKGKIPIVKELNEREN